jgi:hypothetical protein
MNITKTQATDKLQEIESALQSIAFYIGQQANAQQEREYITAAQARELGAGKAEWRGASGAWYKCGEGYAYTKVWGSEAIEYCAIKQAQPEPVDPHAALRAEYARQCDALPCELGFYLWESKYSDVSSKWFEPSTPQFRSHMEYRCTDISCYVSKDGEPAIRMLRTEAKELQAELGDTVEWLNPKNCRPTFKDGFRFSMDGIYTYRTKATIKLNGEMVTPEQAAAEWEAKKETCNIFHRSANNPSWWNLGHIPAFDTHNSEGAFGEYETRPKALKQVSWSDAPVGITVTYRGQTYPMHRSPVMGYPCIITTDGLICQDFSNSSFGLAPASEQPWMYWGGGGECPVPEGCTYEITMRSGVLDTEISPKRWNHVGFQGDIIAYRITGIAKGYVLGGAV